MKIKNKGGKVHPSPSSSSSSDGVVLSVLQLLPAAIVALASVLSLEDREVLAYMITRSMKTSPSSSTSSNTHRKSSKKSSSITNSQSHSNNNNHRPPMFDCECFDCYRSYWFKWDSSPNRELIHQAIEAFEDHLVNGEKPKKNAGRGKRRDKMGLRGEAQKPAVEKSSEDEVFAAAAEEEDVVVSSVPEVMLPVCDVVSAENVEEMEEKAVEVKVEMTAAADDMVLVLGAAAVRNHKGLARKVLSDVLGLFNSRLWNLWSPNA